MQQKKTITVSDNTVAAEALGDFFKFKNLGKKGPNTSKDGKKCFKKSRKTLEHC